MSNTTQETRSFLKLVAQQKGLNPRLVPVDCAQVRENGVENRRAELPLLANGCARLANAEVTPEQVQVIWLKEANSTPQAPFPAEAKKMQQNLVDVLHILHGRFANLKIVYLSSRIYGGYAGGAAQSGTPCLRKRFCLQMADCRPDRRQGGTELRPGQGSGARTPGSPGDLTSGPTV